MLAFDIETTGLSPTKCDITVICAEDCVTGAKHNFEFARYPDRKSDMRRELIELFDAADSLCAFNGIRFDLPFMQVFLNIDVDTFTRWVAKTSDILEQSRLLHRKTFSLNKLCQTNGIPVKISDGKQAIVMAREKRFDELLAYCEQDVVILCDIYRQQNIKLAFDNGPVVDLCAWAHPHLYIQEPTFLDYARKKLQWTTMDCAVFASKKMQCYFEATQRGRDMDQHDVACCMDQTITRCDLKGHFEVTLVHNEMSQAYSDWLFAMDL